MKYEKMTPEQMSDYVRRMDDLIIRLKLEQERILTEVGEMKKRKGILSWDEIASAVAYPKTLSDRERTDGENPDEFKLFHQAERINRIYISQMEDLLIELEGVETQITKYKYVSHCISMLSREDKEVIDKFLRHDMTFENGARVFHTSRSSLYRQQKKALEMLTSLYNNGAKSGQ